VICGVEGHARKGEVLGGASRDLGVEIGAGTATSVVCSFARLRSTVRRLEFVDAGEVHGVVTDEGEEAFDRIDADRNHTRGQFASSLVNVSREILIGFPRGSAAPLTHRERFFASMASRLVKGRLGSTSIFGEVVGVVCRFRCARLGAWRHERVGIERRTPDTTGERRRSSIGAGRPRALQ